jgi:hypothetical protein
MAKIEIHLKRPSPIRLKNDKLTSANETAILTSASTMKDDLPVSAAAATTPVMASDTTFESDMRAFTPTKASNHTVEDGAIIPATTITTPGKPSDSSISIFRLPRELRDYIYTHNRSPRFEERLPIAGHELGAVLSRCWIGSGPLFRRVQVGELAHGRDCC